MSYARMGNDSDVYVYDNGLFFICCACRLLPVPNSEIFEEYMTESLVELSEHLKRHEEEKHKVPKYAWARINEELLES